MALSLRRRVGAAISVLTGQGSKAAPFVFPAWRDGQPQWHMVDLRSYIEEGFNLNTIVYESVMYKARAVTLAPLRAYTGERDRPKLLPISHPLQRLLLRPNDFQSQIEFAALCEVYLNVTGNVFIFLDRDGKVNGLPQAMYTLRPDRVYIVPKNGRVYGYVYVPEGKSWQDGINILPMDMIHVKLPNPADPLDGLGYGLSPISALARSGDVDNSVSRFLKLFFDRGMMLGGVLKFPTSLNDEILARTKERWKQMYGGSDNWATEIGVLDNNASYERITPTFDQMGFAAIDERNETRIAGPFGVPPILIGTRVGLQRSTYSNYEQARKACWEDTLVFEINIFETEYQHYLVGVDVDDLFVAADISKVPALRANVVELTQAAVAMINVGVPPNIAFQKVGLDVEDLEFGDYSFMSAGYQLTENVINPPAPPSIPGMALPGRKPPALQPGEDNPVTDPETETEGEQAQSAAKKYISLQAMLKAQSRNGKRPTMSG